MLKKIIWPILSFMSVALSIVFILGFIFSVNISNSKDKDYIEKPMENLKDISEEGDKVMDDSSEIIIMGDSIGFGVGDEENLGIGKRYLDLINKKEKTQIDITNISVPGYTTDELVDLVKSEENKYSISNADLIIISIGGNDLNRLNYEDNLAKNIEFKEALKKYKENLEFIITEIRSINTDAQLAFIGLYNPYSGEVAEKSRVLLEWNYETRLIVDSDFKFVYIPTYELFQYHLDEYLSLDDFHPSAAGYQIIAEELYRILN